MTTQLFKWKIFCTTDNQDEYIWQTTSPTACPVNGGHTVDLNQISKESSINAITIDNTDSPYNLAKNPVLCNTTSGNIIVNLPPSNRADNAILFIQKIASGNTVTITPNGSNLIDASSNKILSSLSETAILLSDGTNWISQTQRANVNNSLPITHTKGDILVDTGSEIVRLPVGSDNYLLKASSAEEVGVIWTNSIDSTIIANGSVSNAEYQYLNGVTSAIQTQLNTKITTTSANTLTNKIISSTTNTIGANELRTTGSSVVIDTAAPPSTGQILKATSATSATWQDAGSNGDVTAAANLTTEGLVVGADGAKGVKTGANWTLDANGVLGSGFNHAGYILDVHNTKNDGGGNGFRIMAGETLGDIAFHVADTDDTFQIMEMEADQGFITLGKTYAQTITDNGIAHGVDIQHSGDAKDFNTQVGIYRIGGMPCFMGTYFENASNNDESFTTSTSFIQELRLTTMNLPSGTYRIGWSFSIKNNSGSGSEYRVQLNDSTTIFTGNGTDSSTPGFVSCSGFYYATNTSGVQNIDVDYRAISGTSYIKETRLEIWRMS